MKTSELARIRNRSVRTKLRASLKDVRTATSRDDGLQKLKVASVVLDKAATYGIIHKKNAARNKSRLARFVSKLT